MTACRRFAARLTAPGQPVDKELPAQPSPGSVTFNYVSQAGGPGDPAAGDPFYITGKLAALDAAGEWFRGATTKTLYLWTPTGDSPGNHVVEAKARTYGFHLSGLS